jgi:AbrB family looped-hinge helix DNA binding protein
MCILIQFNKFTWNIAMKISERGQVTIPQEIREKFGFLPNTEVEFVVEEGSVRIVRILESRRKAVEEIYGRKQFGRTTDELMKLLRE